VSAGEVLKKSEEEKKKKQSTALREVETRKKKRISVKIMTSPLLRNGRGSGGEQKSGEESLEKERR